jgi:hypothetical protein
MMGLGSNGCLVTGAPCLNGGHGYSFASNVGHLRLNSIGLLVYDGMRTYSGHLCCITGPLGQHQPWWEWVNILGNPYRIALWQDYCYNHIYIYILSILHTSSSFTMKEYYFACDFNLNWVHKMITCVSCVLYITH